MRPIRQDPADGPALARRQLICQKDSFLCAARGVSVGIAFQKKLGVGLFGGEGFIMQKLEGDGLASCTPAAPCTRSNSRPGETLRVDTGCLVAFQPSVSYDIQFVGKLKSAFFGGEGLFFATLTGPGRVWLQSLPLSRLAHRIYAAAPQTGGWRKEEGSVLDRVWRPRRPHRRQIAPLTAGRRCRPVRHSLTGGGPSTGPPVPFVRARLHGPAQVPPHATPLNRGDGRGGVPRSGTRRVTRRASDLPTG